MNHIKKRWRNYKGKLQTPWLYRREDLLDDTVSMSEVFDDFFKEKAETLVGTWVNSQYFILSFIGRGTFSIVYMAYCLEKRDYVVLKMLLPCYKEEAKYEIQIIEKLQQSIHSFPYSTFIWKKHPNIICIEEPHLGVSLSEILQTTIYKSKGIDNIIHYFYDCLKQLNQIHESGIIHSDLKLDNILTTFDMNYNHSLKLFFNRLNPNKMIHELAWSYKRERSSNFNHITWSKCVKLAQREFSKHFQEKFKSFKQYRNQLRLDILENVKEVDDFEHFECDNLAEVNIDTEIVDTNKQTHAYLIDFGNSLFNDTLEKDDVCFENYRPPENIINLEISFKTDIWSMGCLFFEMITNQSLFDISNITTSIEKEHRASLESINTEESLSSVDCIEKARLAVMYLLCHLDKDVRNNNIKNEIVKHSLFQIDQSRLNLITELISSMLQIEPEGRPSAKDLLDFELFKPFTYDSIIPSSPNESNI